MAGGKNTTKTTNRSGGSKTAGGKGKGKESKKDAAGGEGEKKEEGGNGGKLKAATAINSRHILVSLPFLLISLSLSGGGRKKLSHEKNLLAQTAERGDEIKNEKIWIGAS